MAHTNWMETRVDEMNRRTALLAQASRIRKYLPTLKTRKAAVEQELSELRALIADEEAAAEDLEWEAEHSPAQIQARQRHQSPESAA